MESPPSLLSTLFLLMLWVASSWIWGRAFLPLSRHIFPNLLDGGLAAGRLLALVLVGLLVFLGASLHIYSLQFSPLLMLGAPLVLQWQMRRDPERHAEFLSWAHLKQRDLLASDLIFVLVWLLFAWIRLQNPALSDLEKPMDVGMLASATRAIWLPFENWWMAGVQFTNYYYFAPLLGSLPTRTLATPPHIAYNLVQPLFCAMFASILAALCASLCRPCDDPQRTFSSSAWARGAWAMSIVSLLGNWEPLRQMQQAGRWLWPSELDWWKTSRVIKHTINEYPAFTQTTGDIHAHFYALSLAALLFSLAWSLFHAPPDPARAPTKQQVLARSNDSVLNSSGTVEVRLEAHPAKSRSKSVKSKKRRAKNRVQCASASARSTAAIEAPHKEDILYAPPARPTAPTPSGDVSAGEASVEHWLRWARVLSIGAMLGAFILGNTWDVPVYALLSLACSYLSLGGSKSKRVQWILFAQQAGAMLGIALVLALPYLALYKPQVGGVRREFWLPNLAEWTLVWSGIVALSLISIRGARRVEKQRRAMWQVLALCGALALISPYFFYIQGAFDDNGRGPERHQDTVFKFGLHAWLLLGTSGACGVWWLLDTWRIPQRRLATLGWGVAWAIPLSCTLGVISFRTVSMKSPIAPSFDGSFPIEDAKGIAWLSANAPPGSIVLEAAKPDLDYYGYNEFGRVASLTGVPTVAGWTSHMGYWGANWGRDIVPRLQSIRAAWNAPDSESAQAVLRHLKITHIFIGEIERRTYTPHAIQMMKSLGRVEEVGSAAVVHLQHS